MCSIVNCTESERKQDMFVCWRCLSVRNPRLEIVVLIGSENHWRYLDDNILDWHFELYPSCYLGCQSSTTRVLPTLHRNLSLYPQMVLSNF